MKLIYSFFFTLQSLAIFGQNYCLSIGSLTDNGTTVSYPYSISTGPIALNIDISILIEGTGGLTGTALIGGTSNSSYNGNFSLTKTGSGAIGYNLSYFGPALKSSDGSVVPENCFVLPITLSSFSATKHSDRSSRLSWTTASEINSEYFGIERSSDGETWENLDRITAASNSNEVLAYAYIDDRLPFNRSKDQIFYYRLRLTDLDGTYKYSVIKGVNFTRLQNDIVSIYPNPTTDRVNVDVSGIDATVGEIQISIFDFNGRNMLHKNIIGTGIELIETLNYPAGTYNFVVKHGETIYQKKVIKLD